MGNGLEIKYALDHHRVTVIVMTAMIIFPGLQIKQMTRENRSSVVFEQQRCRPACTSAQSDQRLGYSLNGMYHIKTCYKQYFTILASLCSCVEWFVYDLVGNHEDRFWHVAAQMSSWPVVVSGAWIIIAVIYWCLIPVFESIFYIFLSY